MPPLLVDLLRPQRRTIVALLSATLVQMAMTLAVPWPLKSILDNVVGDHPAPGLSPPAGAFGWPITTPTGWALLSTLTGDVQTIQSCASTSTLSIVTDTLSLLATIVVMFLLRWDFALIALAVTPPLAAFVLRVNRAVRTAVTEVRTGSPICWRPCRKACSRSR